MFNFLLLFFLTDSSEKLLREEYTVEEELLIVIERNQSGQDIRQELGPLEISQAKMPPKTNNIPPDYEKLFSDLEELELNTSKMIPENVLKYLTNLANHKIVPVEYYTTNLPVIFAHACGDSVIQVKEVKISVFLVIFSFYQTN